MQVLTCFFVSVSAHLHTCQARITGPWHSHLRTLLVAARSIPPSEKLIESVRDDRNRGGPVPAQPRLSGRQLLMLVAGLLATGTVLLAIGVLVYAQNRAPSAGGSGGSGGPRISTSGLVGSAHQRRHIERGRAERNHHEPAAHRASRGGFDGPLGGYRARFLSRARDLGRHLRRTRVEGPGGGSLRHGEPRRQDPLP